MTQTPLSPHDAKQYSPLSLAFLGDSVFDTLIREQLLRTANQPPAALHQKKVALVCAGFQATVMRELLPTLTEEEQAVFLRGRNAAPKHAHQGISLCDRAGSVVWISLSDRCSRPHAETDAADSANCRIPSRFDGRCSRKSIDRRNTHVRTL